MTTKGIVRVDDVSTRLVQRTTDPFSAGGTDHELGVDCLLTVDGQLPTVDSFRVERMPSEKHRRCDHKPVTGDRERDRRHGDRIPVDIEVDYECQETFLYAYITDIGALGIFLRTNAP
jgi:hypothetical protein